ncbi:MAG: hypothetical protein ABIM36_04925 [candidate division WOR-3 bacterium]
MREIALIVEFIKRKRWEWGRINLSNTFIEPEKFNVNPINL